MKKIISVFLTVILAFSLSASALAAAPDGMWEDIRQTLNPLGVSYAEYSGETEDTFYIRVQTDKSGTVSDEVEAAINTLTGKYDCLSVEYYLPYSAAYQPVLDDNGLFPNIYSLYEYWDVTKSYPEYVAGVSSTDGGEALTVTLVMGYEAAEDEIRAMLADDTGLTFAYGGSYSEAYLQQVNDEIVQNYMRNGSGDVYGCGVGWHIVDGAVVGFGESGTESRVTVAVAEDKVDYYAQLFEALYGDAVFVEGSSGVYAEDAASPTVSDPTSSVGAAAGMNRMLFLLILAGCFIVLGGGYFGFFRPRHRLAYQTIAGNVGMGNAPLTRAETVNAVRQSGIEPERALFDSIYKRATET